MPPLIRLEAIATRVEAIAIRLEAIATRVETIIFRLKAIATRVEAIAIRSVLGLEGVATRVEVWLDDKKLPGGRNFWVLREYAVARWYWMWIWIRRAMCLGTKEGTCQILFLVVPLIRATRSKEILKWMQVCPS